MNGTLPTWMQIVLAFCLVAVSLALIAMSIDMILDRRAQRRRDKK